MKAILLTAASAIAFAAVSYAEPVDLKANIQFPFFAQGVAMAPGSYKVISMQAHGGFTYYQLRNFVANQAVLVTNMIPGEAKSTHKVVPRLVFQCGGETCWLSEVWTGNGTYYHARSIPARVASNEKLRVATVYLDSKVGN